MAGTVLSTIHLTHSPSEAGIRSISLLEMKELAHNTTGK